MSVPEQFNQTIKEIFKLFKELPSQKFKSKLHIGELQTKMVRGMHTETLYAINVLGPLVWRTRKEIVEKDAKFFLDRRYEVELQQMCNEHKINYDNAINTINFMKDAYRGASEATQSQIFVHLTDMLKLYAQHALHQTQTS